MANVIGMLTDITSWPMDSARGIVSFALEAPGLSPAALLTTRPHIAIPNAQGVFSADLVPTYDMPGNAGYRVVTTWLNGEDIPVGKDVYPELLYVPMEGGSVPVLLNRAPGPMQAIYSPYEPEPWPLGAVWINTLTWDVSRKDA
jgi:hypothetical protein